MNVPEGQIHRLKVEMKEGGKGERDQKRVILNRLYWSENRNVETKGGRERNLTCLRHCHESVSEPLNWIRNKKLFRYRKINK